MKNETYNLAGQFSRFPTHNMEIVNKHGFTHNDWGTFESDAEAIASAISRKLGKGLRVLRVIRNGEVIWSADAELSAASVEAIAQS